MGKYFKIGNYQFIFFTTVFLLTIGSELISNLIVLILLALNLKELAFKKKQVVYTIIMLTILIPFYLYSGNQLLVRYIIYIPRFLLLLAIFNRYFDLLTFEMFRKILRSVFLVHCSVILLCFVVPPLNNFLNVALGKAFTSEFRISGLFSGYDFISFFTVFYLYVEYRCSNYKFTTTGYLQLFMGFSATVVSGRFGMVPYLIFFLYIFFKQINLTKIITFGIACVAMFFLFYERIMLFYNTFLLLKDSVNMTALETSKLSLKDYGSEGQEGFYQLSPLVLYNEATLPFTNFLKYVLPSVCAGEVDSGPSFVIINIGFILAISLYIFYFTSLYKGVKSTAFLTLLIMIMDVKFRIILVLMPTVWILLNLGKLKKFEHSQYTLS